MKKLIRQSMAAAGFAALLVTGACAHNDSVAATTDPTDQVVEVRPEAAGMDANIAGNKDRAPIAPDTTPVTDLTMNTSMTSSSSTTSSSGTTTTIETTNVPMTSSVQESSTTTEETTPARTRMRKD